MSRLLQLLTIYLLLLLTHVCFMKPPNLTMLCLGLKIEKSDPADLIEAEISQFVRLDIDPDTIKLNRVVDVNDQYLR